MDYLPSGFYNMDCMNAMRQFPDKFFDLAVVDPPYGGGGSSQFRNVEREREREREGSPAERPILKTGNGHGSADDSTGILVSRTGGKWAKKYRQRRKAVQTYAIGILHRRRNTLPNWHGSARIKSFGVEITSHYRLHDAFWYGKS